MSQRSNNVSQLILSALWLSVFVCVGFSQTQTLPLFSAQERELKGGETHSYRVTLTAGQFLYALVEQKEIDVSVALFAPDGQQIAETDSPNDRWGTEPVLILAGKTGDFRIDVHSPNSKVAPGRYEIRVVRLREATVEDKDLVRAQRVVEEAEKLGREEKATAKRASIEKYQEAFQLFGAAGETYRQLRAAGGSPGLTRGVHRHGAGAPAASGLRELHGGHAGREALELGQRRPLIHQF